MVAYIDSPFQLFLLYNNSHKIGRDVTLLVIRYNGNPKNDQSLDEILAVLQIDHVVKIRNLTSIPQTRKIIRSLLMKREIILGDYRNKISQFVLLFRPFLKSISFLDDGASTLNLLGDHKLFRRFDYDNINFYSIFKLGMVSYQQISIDYSRFDMQNSDINELNACKNMYISQKFSEAGFFDLSTELSLVKKINSMCSDMLVILHRSDSILKRKKYKEMGLRTIELVLPFECYLKNISFDTVIHGFSSTCLYNANKYGLDVKVYSPSVTINSVYRSGFFNTLKYYENEIGELYSL